MGDYGFGGTDEENAELKKLNAEVVRLDTRGVGWADTLLLTRGPARGP